MLGSIVKMASKSTRYAHTYRQNPPGKYLVLHLGAHDLFVCIVLYALFIPDMVSYPMNVEQSCIEMHI